MTPTTHAEPYFSAGRLMLRRGWIIPSWCLLAAVFAVAVLMRQFIAANTDVSWLLIAGERWLDGQRLYSDVLETNPPMAVLVYVPGILIGRALGLRAEIVTDGLIFVAAAASLALVSRMLRQSSVLAGIRHGPFLAFAATILLILPVQAFGQREHIAVIELLPALAALMMRSRSERLSGWMVVVAGLGLGLALSFKPHFAIAVLCAVTALALHGRNWRLLFAPEYLIAAAVLGLYGACTLIFFPEYITVIGPLARDVYLPIGLPLHLMLEKPVVPLWAIAVIVAILLKRRTIDAAHLSLIAMALGFGAIFFLQRKGWPYHSYPMMAFALLAVGYGISAGRYRHGWAPTAALCLLLAILFARSMVWFDHAFDGRPIQAAVARLGAHPKILVISAQAGIGHPMTRALGGEWASRQQGLLVAGYYNYLRDYGSPDAQTMAMLDGYAAREREALVADFRKYQPTVVLVDNLTDNWSAWMRASPDLVDLMKGYSLADRVMDIDIYRKRQD